MYSKPWAECLMNTAMKVEVITTCQLIDVHSFHTRPSIKLVQLEGQRAIIKKIWNH